MILNSSASQIVGQARWTFPVQFKMIDRGMGDDKDLSSLSGHGLPRRHRHLKKESVIMGEMTESRN